MHLRGGGLVQSAAWEPASSSLFSLSSGTPSPHLLLSGERVLSPVYGSWWTSQQLFWPPEAGPPPPQGSLRKAPLKSFSPRSVPFHVPFTVAPANRFLNALVPELLEVISDFVQVAFLLRFSFCALIFLESSL